jgi:hypothetical protein
MKTDEIIDLKKNPTFDPRILKLNYIPLDSEDKMDEEISDFDEFRLKKAEMTKKEADIMEKTKEYNRKLADDPKDALLWIEFINF